MRCVEEQLAEALLARAAGAATILRHHAVPWRAMLYDGVRHEIALAIGGAEAARFGAGIAEAEFDLRGHVVADICITPAPGRLHIEALTIADAA